MYPTLLDTMTTRADARFRMAEQIGAVLFVTILTAIAAQISVPLPFTPVPFTFQPMVVLLGAAALGPRLGLSSQILYLALGIAGLPVFAASPLLPQGAARLLGPTGGYLMAYPFAAFAAGWLAERGFDRRYLTAVASMICGLAVVFAGGVLVADDRVQAVDRLVRRARRRLRAVHHPRSAEAARRGGGHAGAVADYGVGFALARPNTSRNTNGGKSSRLISCSPAALAALITTFGSTRLIGGGPRSAVARRPVDDPEPSLRLERLRDVAQQRDDGLRILGIVHLRETHRR